MQGIFEPAPGDSIRQSGGRHGHVRAGQVIDRQAFRAGDQCESLHERPPDSGEPHPHRHDEDFQQRSVAAGKQGIFGHNF